MRLKLLVEQVDGVLSELQGVRNPKVQALRKEIDEIKQEFQESIDILLTSTSLLNFVVHDMLAYAQINGGKFRQVITKFDIRQAVQEVMSIQKDKARFNEVALTCEFHNLENVVLICTDKQRL